ncbi:hypothetical protein N665_0258s0015 [Sinapis alba]|nr:hypothetical protein N665_0258s0015 [Sinapis alba]
MDQQKPTASDLETEKARRLAKIEAGLANVKTTSRKSSSGTTSRKSSSGTTYQTTSRKSSSGTTYQTTSRKSSGKSSRKSSRSVPSFCQTNKIWGIHIDDIYAPVNYKNSHWLGIWILIPKRHIVVWDIIVGCIRQAQLDHVMAPFVNMVRYFLVECAATIEEHCKYSLEPFTYEIANAPQCESGDYDLFALKYIECHALGFPFPGSLNPKNSKTIREKMAVDIFEEIPDAHQTEITDVDVNQGILNIYSPCVASWVCVLSSWNSNPDCHLDFFCFLGGRFTFGGRHLLTLTFLAEGYIFCEYPANKVSFE